MLSSKEDKSQVILKNISFIKRSNDKSLSSRSLLDSSRNNSRPRYQTEQDNTECSPRKLQPLPFVNIKERSQILKAQESFRSSPKRYNLNDITKTSFNQIDNLYGLPDHKDNKKDQLSKIYLTTNGKNLPGKVIPKLIRHNTCSQLNVDFQKTKDNTLDSYKGQIQKIDLEELPSSRGHKRVISLTSRNEVTNLRIFTRRHTQEKVSLATTINDDLKSQIETSNNFENKSQETVKLPPFFTTRRGSFGQDLNIERRERLESEMSNNTITRPKLAQKVLLRKKMISNPKYPIKAIPLTDRPMNCETEPVQIDPLLTIQRTDDSFGPTLTEQNNDNFRMHTENFIPSQLLETPNRVTPQFQEVTPNMQVMYRPPTRKGGSRSASRGSIQPQQSTCGLSGHREVDNRVLGTFFERKLRSQDFN